MCKCSGHTGVCHTVMYQMGIGACPSTVSDMCLAGCHLSVSNSFLFICPLNEYLLSTYVRQTITATGDAAVNKTKVLALRKLCLS